MHDTVLKHRRLKKTMIIETLAELIALYFIIKELRSNDGFSLNP